MPTLQVPETGLSLCRDNPGDDSAARPTQIMRLNLAQNTLNELIDSLRTDKPARIRLGKHQTLYYDSNKSQHFHASSESYRSEIYSNNPAGNGKLYFTGILSHNLEVQKAQEATAATDQALANLEQSLSAFERGKESKKTHIITDISQVRALRAGDSRSSTGKQAALLARMPSSKVELEKDRLLKNKANSNRSVSSSPALGVARSPISIPPLTPTSAPPSQNKDRLRLEALKVPFIHLLAVRAVSTKFLARQTRSSIEDCTLLAQRFGVENRLNPEKFDLRDKVYRELDVWKFPYPSLEDRQEAIENAISAFDRMRISRSDKLWQSLYPKDERGKGKSLSRLHLRTGPITTKATTPRIQISDETGKEGYTTSQETDKSTGSVLSSSSKPGEPKTAPKSGVNMQKKRGDNDSSAAKRPPTKSKATTNSTLTGRVTKKSEKKAPSKIETKFKSAEYVHDSDDDDTDLLDVSSSEKSQSRPKPKPLPKPSESRPPRETSHVPTPKAKQTDVPLPKADISSSNKPSATKRPPSSVPPSQKSPQKPSPLASSSPSTKASDLQSRSRSSSQNNSSSSSSSPLITQLSRPRVNTERPNAKQPIKPNGVARLNEVTNPLKRKVETERPLIHNAGRIHGDLDHKRRRAVSTSSGSTGSASPPLSREILLQRLREKSQKFKRFYAKYRSLHDAMAAHSNPPRAELEKLQQQHKRLQLIKEEIWDEDRRLRG
ncbi:hypothetical protein BDW59DRAFT_137246 [Aspergillus cavernicola]|uniref:RING-type E3 ubiquitin transferase n=1 Tax=Aspergillus cavernicola TaxID=176166 RepID=A0ABR4J7Z2_9EURO